MPNHILEHFAEWAKWDECMEQDRDWQRLIHEMEQDRDWQRLIHEMEQDCEWQKVIHEMEQDRDWQRLIHEDDEALFRLEMAATEDQLPTPSLFVVWEKRTKDQAVCPLCRVHQCSLNHILSSCRSSCNSALKQGRYTWRHDSTLLALYQQTRSLRNQGKAVFKLGLVCQMGVRWVSYGCHMGVIWVSAIEARPYSS